MHEGMKVVCLPLRQEAWYFLVDVATTLGRYKGDLLTVTALPAEAEMLLP